MENYPQIKKRSGMFQNVSVKTGRYDNNPLDECRSLVQALAKKTENLYRECRHDRDKATHIRAMGTTLAALSIHVNRLEHDSLKLHRPEIHEDALGVMYESVRSCDLNRICDK